MRCDIISAIQNIASFRSNDLRKYSSTYLNRINAVGEQLEFYIKDAISNSFTKPQSRKEAEYAKVFSYLGNQNNPPDMIIERGDAFEIKKIESPYSALALNSSPPKDVLHSSDKRITAECKRCEKEAWKEKDLFYVVGHANKGAIKYLFFIQGTCYAAKSEVYEKIHAPLKQEISDVIRQKNLEGAETVELGKVKRVDPLGITELRIRGMWDIQNPMRVYSSLCKLNSNKFSLFAIMRKEKYDSFPSEDIKKLENTKGISVKDIKIKDPNNPAKLVDAKLISFSF
jgi:hypothetical protein